MTGEPRCEWDGFRSINELTLGGTIARSSSRWVLQSVDNGGSSEYFVDALLDLETNLVDNVIVSLCCRKTFFVPRHSDNLIDSELWELAAAVGQDFEPDEMADEFIFEAEGAGLSCVIWDGRVSSVWLSDYDLIDEDTPDAPRPVGAG
jgi:hypothetical protein